MNKKYFFITLVLGLAVFLLINLNKQEVKSGIKGVVKLGPTCEGRSERDDPACADKLYQTELELVDFKSLKVVKTFSSKIDGTFSITAYPGEYMINSVKKIDGKSVCGKNGLVPVEINKYSEVIVFCDTGIR